MLAGKIDKPFVYQVWSQSGCGCGFFVDELHPEEIPDRLVAMGQLVALISETLVDGEVELYTCWAGEEHEPAAVSVEMYPYQLLEPGFEFRNRQHITLLKHS